MTSRPPELDEAFLPLAELLAALLPDPADLVDHEAGVRSRVVAVDVQTPVELHIAVAPDGQVRLGGTPPLYHLATTDLPVFHRVQLAAVRADGGES